MHSCDFRTQKVREGPLGTDIFARSLVSIGLNPPIKLYFHRSGYQEAFRGAMSIDNGTDYVRKSFLETMSNQTHINNNETDFYIGILWGEKGVKHLDLFGYYGADVTREGTSWGENLEYKQIIIANGRVLPKEQEAFCQDTDIIRGLEGAFCRSTRNFNEFISEFPTIQKVLQKQMMKSFHYIV